MRPRNEKNRTSAKVTLFILSLLLALFTYTASLSAQAPGTFIPTGNITIPRGFHTATLLMNGKVLITGGNVLASGNSRAELYDPVTGTFTATGNMTTRGLSATLLPDGRVLIADEFSAELYDPATGTFTPTGNMLTPQWSHKATLLDNGKVLITGGAIDSFFVRSDNPELYDPITGTFTATGDYADKGTDPDGGDLALLVATASLLPNGKVLIAAEPTAELYDPATGTFSLTGQMTTTASGEKPSSIWSRTATLLTDGKVLLTGGLSGDGGGYFAKAELYDPSTGNFTAIGNMTKARGNHTATLLRDGTVLIAGGSNASSVTDTAELFDPATNTFAAIGTINSPRGYHTATLLMDGRILITGGMSDPRNAMSSAELYVPFVLIPAQVVTDLRFDRTSVVAGSSYSVNVSGSNLTSQTFFDVRFTSPRSNAYDVVLNWQSGFATSHVVPAGTAAGSWTINGVRAHQIETDHTGSFIPVSATITVSP